MLGCWLPPLLQVYAFGIMLFELATGRKAFQGLRHGEIVTRLVMQVRAGWVHARLQVATCQTRQQCSRR